ncbi:Aur protein kinase [Anncaliia algerae PRA339]|uniref:Aurora kinase n=1 Tax=Anncaliia algerae PRA339 TaxID=1288291 RepID=A0A059F177_9MICR|nr:Aur protein kinase [Anncaliia algerae PRA339]
MKNWTIDDFELGKPLGRGRFGQVWLAKEKDGDCIVALKIIPKKEISTMDLAKQLRREIEIHTNLKHPNVVRMYGHFHDAKNVYLILEYAGKGEIYSLLELNGKFTEKMAANYIYQVAEALAYMQSMNVIHRDIKPENLLLGCDDQIKISDFGWAVKNRDGKRLTYCGTPQYLAPEMYEKTVHNNTIDIWCLGILCYEFLVGETPFDFKNKTTAETYQIVKNLKYQLPDFLSLEARDFIRRVLKVEPKERMSLKDVINHFWIVKHCCKENVK